jgi:dienelactone hydrolase
VSTADERVSTAWRVWRPRFLANGIPLADVVALQDTVTVWDEWCEAWSARARAHHALAEAADAERAWLTAAEHYLRAAWCYHFGKFFFFQDWNQHLAAHRAMLAAYRRAGERLGEPLEWVRIPFGDTVIPGVLRRPPHAGRPPLVIVLPGLDSVKEELHGIGTDLLNRGLAVLAIDGPGQGEMGLTTPIRPDYEVAVTAVVDYIVTARPEFDSSRIGVLGIAFGGYYAVRALAAEPRLRAAAAVGTTDSLAQYYDQVPGLTQEALRFRLGVDTADEAKRALAGFHLRDLPSPLSRPLLVIAGGQDRVFPVEASRRIVDRVGPTARLVVYPEGNHVCNNVPYKYRALQADWLCRHLAGNPDG